MKKLLAVATIAVVGYKVTKKVLDIRKRNKVADIMMKMVYEKGKENNTINVEDIEMENEEVVENIEEEIVIDNDEENIQVEDIEVVEEEKVNTIDGIKNMFRKPIKSILKICVRTGYILWKILDKIRIRIVKLTDSERYETISNFESNELMYKIEYYCKIIELYICHFIYTGVKGLMAFIIFSCKNIVNLNNNL